MSYRTAEKALIFFWPFLSSRYYLNFYGGEPLLRFDFIRDIVAFLEKRNKRLRKRARYSITTNGSLLREEVIRFLDTHRFSVVLSFDGLAQDIQRKKGSFKEIVSHVSELLSRPSIGFETNSVFHPGTVNYLSESMRFIIDLGVKDINFSLSLLKPWGSRALSKLEAEMEKLGKILLSHYKKEHTIPVADFREDRNRGIFYCAAGRNRLALTTDGGIWGCDLFADYFMGKENRPEAGGYYFGDLNAFSEDYRKIYRLVSSNYARLSQDNFSTPAQKCLFCEDIESCFMCPVNAAFSSGRLGEIPRFACEILRIKIKAKTMFRQALQKLQG